MKIWTIAICLMFVSMPGLAEKTVSPEMAKRAALLQTLSRGKQITVNNQTYQHLPEVFAVAHADPGKGPQELLAQVGASTGSLIETKGPYVVYRSGQPQAAPSVSQIGSVTVYPTVLNTENGTIGVLLGTVEVKPKRMADAAAIGSDLGLEMIREFPHLRTVFYKVRNNRDVIQAAAALGADSRIESAYPEVLEYPVVPH